MKRKFHFFYLFAFVIAVLFVSCTPNDSEDQVDSTQMIQDENGDSGEVSQEGTEGDNTDQTTQDNNGNSDNTSQEGTEGGNTDETTQDNNDNTDCVNQGEIEVVNTDIAPDFTFCEAINISGRILPSLSYFTAYAQFLRNSKQKKKK